jgi:hypothetical protein
VVLIERERMILVLKTYALDIPLQEKVTTHLSHNDTTFAYVWYQQNFKTLSMILFSQSKLKTTGSKVSIPCCKQLFSVWAGQPT